MRSVVDVNDKYLGLCDVGVHHGDLMTADSLFPQVHGVTMEVDVWWKESGASGCVDMVVRHTYSHAVGETAKVLPKFVFRTSHVDLVLPVNKLRKSIFKQI